MGHTKCGKTTLLNRTAFLLQQDGYATVFFDVAELASRTFEYTTVLLLLAEQVVRQLADSYDILIGDADGPRLLDFLLDKEITTYNALYSTTTPPTSDRCPATSSTPCRSPSPSTWRTSGRAPSLYQPSR